MQKIRQNEWNENDCEKIRNSLGVVKKVIWNKETNVKKKVIEYIHKI